MRELHHVFQNPPFDRHIPEIMIFSPGIVPVKCIIRVFIVCVALPDAAVLDSLDRDIAVLVPSVSILQQLIDALIDLVTDMFFPIAENARGQRIINDLHLRIAAEPDAVIRDLLSRSHVVILHDDRFIVEPVAGHRCRCPDRSRQVLQSLNHFRFGRGVVFVSFRQDRRHLITRHRQPALDDLPQSLTADAFLQSFLRIAKLIFVIPVVLQSKRLGGSAQRDSAAGRA